MIKAVFYFEGGQVSYHSENTREVRTNFLPGIYSVTKSGQDAILREVEMNEIFKPFPNQKYSEILDTITKFLIPENKETVNQIGFVYKLNMLFFGKQGVGKTALMNFIANHLKEAYEAIVFRVDNLASLEVTWDLATEIRKIQNNPIVFLLDEFEGYCVSNQEAKIKNKLDGNRSIDYSIVLAATNYIDRVPLSIKNRKSRFRVSTEIDGITNKDIIRDIISDLIKKSNKPDAMEDVDSLVDQLSSEEATIDNIKNTVLDYVMNLKLNLKGESPIGFKKTSDIEEINNNFDKKLQKFLSKGEE